MPEIDKLWNFADPAASERRFREAIVTAYGMEWDELRTQLARALGLQGRFDEGHAELDAIESASGRVAVRVALERGRLFNSAGDTERAVAQFSRAADLARTSGEIGLEIDALHMLGIAAAESERLGWNERAIALAEGSEDPRATRWLGSLLNNTAWSYHDAGAFDRALELFERAQVWHQQFGTPETRQIAQWSVGRCLRSLGRFDEALSIQRSLAGEIGDEWPDGFVLEEIAENLYEQGRADEAAPWFARAADVLASDPWLAETEPERLARLRELGHHAS
jgi:tetratricopeptide (TPR) repeat protein